MPRFSSESTARLSECHPDLQRLFLEVVKVFDCTVLVGHRSQAAQDQAFAEGKSKLKYPQSKHNSIPSRAIDVAPFPIDFQRDDRFFLFAGYVLKTAEILGVHVRWGGDWDRTMRKTPNKFEDLVHWELL